MRQEELSEEDYSEYKSLYDTRVALPIDHPDKWFNMSHYLKHYNNLDVEPLVEALTTCFEKFHQYFGVDPGTVIILEDKIYHGFI